MTEESSSLTSIVLSPNCYNPNVTSANVIPAGSLGGIVAPANLDQHSEWDLGPEKNPFLEMSQDQIQKLDAVLSSEQAQQILGESSHQFALQADSEKVEFPLSTEPAESTKENLNPDLQKTLEDSLSYIMSGSNLSMLETKTEEILQVFATATDPGCLPTSSQEFILTGENVEIATEILGSSPLHDHDYNRTHIGNCIILDHPYSLVPPTVAPAPIIMPIAITPERVETDSFEDCTSPMTPGSTVLKVNEQSDVSSPIRRSQRQIEKHEREQLEKIRAENAEMARRERAEMLRRRRSGQGDGPKSGEDEVPSPLENEEETEKRIASICGEAYEGPSAGEDSTAPVGDRESKETLVVVPGGEPCQEPIIPVQGDVGPPADGFSDDKMMQSPNFEAREPAVPISAAAAEEMDRAEVKVTLERLEMGEAGQEVVQRRKSGSDLLTTTAKKKGRPPRTMSEGRSDSDSSEKAKKRPDNSKCTPESPVVDKSRDSPGKAKSKLDVGRKTYPKRENRKPPQHLMDMFEPALFSKPDQLKKVGCESGEKRTDCAIDVVTSRVAEMSGHPMYNSKESLHDKSSAVIDTKADRESDAEEKVPDELDEPGLEDLDESGELMIVVAVDDPAGGDNPGGNLIQITGSAVGSESPQMMTNQVNEQSEEMGPVRSLTQREEPRARNDAKVPKKDRLANKKVGKFMSKHGKISNQGRRVLSSKKKRSKGQESEGQDLSGSDSDAAFQDDNGDSDWHSEDDPDRLWCICKQPHNDRFMISCDVCGDWFHGTCVGVTKKQGRELEKSGKEWHCSKCRKGKIRDGINVAADGKGAKPEKEKKMKQGGDKAMKSELSKFIRTKPPGKLQNKPVKKNAKTPFQRSMLTSASKLQPGAAVRTPESKDPNLTSLPRTVESIATVAATRPVEAKVTNAVARPVEMKVANAVARQVEAKVAASVAQQPVEAKQTNALARPVDPKHANTVVARQVEQKHTNPVARTPDAKSARPAVTSTAERKLPKIPKLPGTNTAAAPSTNNVQSAKCVGCGRPARVDSVYCSNDCIKQHAAESLHVLNKEKKAMVKKSEPINLKESSAGTKVCIVDRKTGKPVTGVNAPSDGNLQAWLRDHPMYEISRQKELLASTKKPAAQPSSLPSTPAAPTPTVAVEEKKEEKKFVAPEVKPASRGPEPIRLNVRKTLKDILVLRSKDADDVLLTADEIRAISLKIEEELFKYFGDIGNKYKAKYRSLMFNIKDNRNHGLFRKILKGRITPYKLVRMTPEELASRELAQWRERENKHAIEMIKKDQELQQQVSHIIKKTHKGEIEIDDIATSFIEPVKPEEPGLDKAEKAVKPKQETAAVISDPILGTMLTDTTDGHRSHLFDLNCKICTGKMAPPADEPPAKKARILKTVVTEEKPEPKVRIELPQKEEENEVVVEARQEEEVKVLKPARKDADKNAAVKVVRVVKIDVDKEREPTSTVVIRSPDSAIPTQSDADVKGKNSTPTVWKGFITMQEVAKFVTIAQKVSGHTDFLSQELPDTIHVCGRINPITVWDYISKQKNSQTKELLIIRFQPANEEEKASYLSFYTYLSTRNRFGVVATASKTIKDFYIVPLAANATVPSSLKPFDGPGLGEPRTNTLLGLIIRHKVKKRGADGESISRLQPKSQKKRVQISDSSTSREASYTPPLDPSSKGAKRVTVPNLDDEPYEPSNTPPLETKASKKRKAALRFDGGGFTPPLDKVPRVAADVGGDSPYSPKDDSPGDDDEPYDPEEADKETKEASTNLIPSLLKGAVTAQNVSELIDQISMSANPTEITTSVLASIATATNLEQQRRLLIELTQKVEEQKRQLEMQKKQIASTVTATIIGSMPLPIVPADTMLPITTAPIIPHGIDLSLSTPQPVPPPLPMIQTMIAPVVQDTSQAYSPSCTPPLPLSSGNLLSSVESYVPTSLQSAPTFLLGDTSSITLPPNLQDILERIKNPIPDPVKLSDIPVPSAAEPPEQAVKSIGGILEDPIVKRFSTHVEEEEDDEDEDVKSKKSTPDSLKDESTVKPEEAEEDPKPPTTQNTDPRLKGKTIQVDPRVRTHPQPPKPTVTGDEGKLSDLQQQQEQKKKSELGSLSASELLEKAMMQFHAADAPTVSPVVPVVSTIPPDLIPIPPSPPPPPPPPPPPAVPKISMKFAPRKVVPGGIRTLDKRNSSINAEPPPPGTEIASVFSPPPPDPSPATTTTNPLRNTIIGKVVSSTPASPLFPSAAYTNMPMPGYPPTQNPPPYPNPVGYPHPANYHGAGNRGRGRGRGRGPGHHTSNEFAWSGPPLPPLPPPPSTSAPPPGSSPSPSASSAGDQTGNQGGGGGGGEKPWRRSYGSGRYDSRGSRSSKDSSRSERDDRGRDRDRDRDRDGDQKDRDRDNERSRTRDKDDRSRDRDRRERARHRD